MLEPPIKLGDRALKEALDLAGRPAQAREARKHRRRFNLVPFNAIKVVAAGPYLVKGLIPRAGLIVIWGPPKCGKSFWTFDLSMHVGLGREYRGRRVQQGAVVYLALEGGDGFRARVEAFRRQHTVTDAPFYLITDRANLVVDHIGLVADVRKQLGEVAPTLVVIDTLNRSLAGSESKDEDMAAYVRAADAIREAFHCAIAVVHHCGVDGSRPRGHTSLTGAADAQLAVKRDQANNIVVTVEWMKDGAEGDKIVSALQTVEVGTDDDGETITSCIIVAAEEEASGPGRVTGAASIALELLRRAVVDAGATPPPSNHIPRDVRTVSLELWKTYCRDGSLTATDKSESRDRAFRRAVEKLQQHNAIGLWQGHVWPIDRTNRT
jgi:hypothetical protein